jgi:hypothetical protein
LHLTRSLVGWFVVGLRISNGDIFTVFWYPPEVGRFGSVLHCNAVIFVNDSPCK